MPVIAIIELVGLGGSTVWVLKGSLLFSRMLPAGLYCSKPMRPLKYAKSEMRSVTSPSARSISPTEPFMSSVTELVLLVTTSRLLAEKSITWSMSTLAWFISTVMFLTVGKRSDMPTTPTLSADAVSAVHLRVGWSWEEIMARPKSMPSIDSPMASSVPPLTPTNTSMSEPPRVSTSALTVSAGS